MIKRLLVIQMVFLCFFINGISCADPEIKLPNSKILYDKLLSKTKIIYFSDDRIIDYLSEKFSTTDIDKFVAMLRETKTSSWNSGSINSLTFPYIFLVDIGTGDQYQIHGNDNGEIVFSYDLIYPGTTIKWMKERNMHNLRRYTHVKILIDKEKLKSLVKPYREKLMKKK